MKIKFLSLALVSAMALTSCSNDDDNVVIPQDNTKTFKLTLKNAINYVNVKKVGSAPLKETGAKHEVKFKATKGTYLSFANMFAQSNDWIFATGSQGIKLWEGDTPKTGDISNYIKVWDAGTEQDEDFLTNFPGTMYTAPKQEGPNMGPADSNTSVRDTGRNIRNYLTASLAYDAVTKEFTLTIEKANREAAHNKGFVTPGILVVHTQPNALFEEGAPVKANGLESLAEDGSPKAIYDWFTEKGSTGGAPLRLSTSYSLLSTPVAYVHQGTQTPLFTKGSPAKAGSGLEELAEDGKADPVYNYLNSLPNVTAVKGTSALLPGEEVTLEIKAKPGDRLNFATMLISSNDWFISNNQQGIELFDAEGNVKTSFVINKSYLYDSGTELDQKVGLGNGQPMNGNEAVANDDDDTVRRVTEIEDFQFGKEKVTSPAGVTQSNDDRGGYNFIDVAVEVVN
ncbi:spondin domain-containing protein [Tenacibaculum maritimum]|uniref:spondin domain-containing protein n=1 Tax=Tenacibaculum maritimum TaxID=107401 RepID=UPI00388F5A12